MENITVQNSTESLISLLTSDPEVYFGWQSNIAMTFYDEFRRSDKRYRISKIDLHQISNNAAKNFLNLLIKEQ